MTVKGIPRISATIYRQKQRKGDAVYTSYTLAYSLLGKLKRETFADLGEAEAAGEDAIRRIADGEQGRPRIAESGPGRLSPGQRSCSPRSTSP